MTDNQPTIKDARDEYQRRLARLQLVTRVAKEHQARIVAMEYGVTVRDITRDNVG